MKGIYGYTNSGLIVPKELAELRVTSAEADIVLDPVCGSGTTAEAASELNRRFICIDMNPDAVDITWNRLSSIAKRGTVRFSFFERRREFELNPMLWDFGCNYLVCGDALDVLRTMPDSFVALVYADPPYCTGKEFRSKDGVGYSDIWKWDDAADDRLEQIRQSRDDVYGDGEKGRQAAVMHIEAVKLIDSDMASYLTWCVLLIGECRRVMGSWSSPYARND